MIPPPLVATVPPHPLPFHASRSLSSLQPFLDARQPAGVKHNVSRISSFGYGDLHEKTVQEQVEAAPPGCEKVSAQTSERDSSASPRARGGTGTADGDERDSARDRQLAD